MINRYTISKSKKEIESFLGKNLSIQDIPKSYNAAPSQQLPILTSKIEVEYYYWGLMSKWANNKTISPRLFNVSTQDLINKPSQKKALRKRRCVILADGFYLWKTIGKKKVAPYYSYLENRSLFGIAGIWDESGDLDENFNCFLLVTTPSSSSIAPYQEDMPFLLDQNSIKAWLEESDEETLIQLLNSPFLPSIAIHAVSASITNTNLNSPTLIEPSPLSDQYGNYSLF